jgi:DNA-binding IclR family transcriptional regulator
MMHQEPTTSALKKHAGVQVIARAAQILSTLEHHPEGLSLSQIAKRVGLARSTVHRIIVALEAEQFVVTVSKVGGRFRLGQGLVALGSSIQDGLKHEIRPFLEQLSHDINETVDLSVLHRDRVLFLDQIPSSQRLQAVASVGSSFPLHCTANGKALLGTFTADFIKSLLPNQLQAYTHNTITERDKLLEELVKIQENGFALDKEEHTLGICAVGAAIRDPRGNLAAITMPIPATRFYGNEPTLIAALRETCNRIGKHFQTF